MDDLLRNLDALGRDDGMPICNRAAARIRELEARYTNCTVCGRVVDTREQADGGDSHGCQYGDKWVCSIECAETLHPDPQWTKDAMNEAQPAAPAVKVKPLVWKWSDRLQGWRADCELTRDVFVAYQSGENWCVGSQYFVSTFHQTSDAGKSHLDQMRAARILAAIEAVPVAEVWRRAMEAAAQAADDMRASLWADTPSKCLTDIGALHEVCATIRAMPMPDDLGMRHA
jgi:hypothetical protein